jgi:ribonuclease VapC
VIAVDTSALMAIVLREPAGEACKAALESEGVLLISAGTLAEALIVAARRNLRDEMALIIDRLGFDIVDLTAASARRVAAAYETWGRGAGTAGLNFGDCFAYELAMSSGCRLLFVGEDLARTDVEPAI